MPHSPIDRTEVESTRQLGGLATHHPLAAEDMGEAKRKFVRRSVLKDQGLTVTGCQWSEIQSPERLRLGPVGAW